MELELANMDWVEAHELLAGMIVPRPIALVSTVGEDGVYNVAPFSFYGAMSVQPAIVYVSIGAKVRAQQKKDTISAETVSLLILGDHNTCLGV